MSALGDIVHALPVLAALRDAYPDAEIDWLADYRYAGVLDFVEGLNRRNIGRPGLLYAVQSMRERAYDAAVDLQGLLKSAAMARLSGARRVIGFERDALRERGAAWFYDEQVTVAAEAHVIQKNLSVLPMLGVRDHGVRFPFVVPPSPVADTLATEAATKGNSGFVLMNPGGAWPNKRWPPERFGELALRIWQHHQLPSYVLWGEDELIAADRVVSAANGAAVRAPRTTLGDLLALAVRATLMISGDTGPIHLAAAMKTPIVGIYGPTWPNRNGPWSARDAVVSRAPRCQCHHKRRCLVDGATGEAGVCLQEISVDEVAAAVDRRLGQ